LSSLVFFFVLISLHNFLSSFCLLFFLCFLHSLLPFLLLHSAPSTVCFRCKYFSLDASILASSVEFLGWGLSHSEAYICT
jgi:hypothetical protein